MPGRARPPEGAGPPEGARPPGMVLGPAGLPGRRRRMSRPMNTPVDLWDLTTMPPRHQRTPRLRQVLRNHRGSASARWRRRRGRRRLDSSLRAGRRAPPGRAKPRRRCPAHQRQAEGDPPGAERPLRLLLGPRRQRRLGLRSPQPRRPPSARGSLLLLLLAREHLRWSSTSPPSAPTTRKRSKYLRLVISLTLS